MASELHGDGLASLEFTVNLHRQAFNFYPLTSIAALLPLQHFCTYTIISVITIINKLWKALDIVPFYLKKFF